jgi:dTDP-4-dehydrorhamnose reductase
MISKKINLIIIGANGYIGRSLYSKAKLDFDVIGTSSDGGGELQSLSLDRPLDFDFNIVNSSSVVIITAAVSSPDFCARENARARAINVTGSSELIKQLLDRGSRVIFFSSDTVYGEFSSTFDETAESNPAGEYAEMKYEVENRFSTNPFFKAIRLSYVFSKTDKLTSYLLGCAEKGDEADIFHPFYRAIVHLNDVIDGALALAKGWYDFPQTVINFGGPQVLSRVDFANSLRDVHFKKLRFTVTEPDEEFFNNRPRIIAMKSPIFARLLGRPARTLTEAARIEFPSV